MTKKKKHDKTHYDKLFAALEELAKEMHSAAVQIDALPEDQEYSMQQIDCIDGLRLEANTLKTYCEHALEALGCR